MRTTSTIALAVLGASLGAMAVGAFSDAVFAPAKLARPAYEPPSAPAPVPAAAAPAAEAPAATPPAPDAALAALIAKGDAAKGEADARVCQACHTFDEGGRSKVGPPLYGVVGRAVASVPRFAYSKAMKKMGGDWTYERLDQLLANPLATPPGTKMTSPVEPEAQKRADILAYLRTLADKPLPPPQQAAQ